MSSLRAENPFATPTTSKAGPEETTLIPTPAQVNMYQSSRPSTPSIGFGEPNQTPRKPDKWAPIDYNAYVDENWGSALDEDAMNKWRRGVHPISPENPSDDPHQADKDVQIYRLEKSAPIHNLSQPRDTSIVVPNLPLSPPHNPSNWPIKPDAIGSLHPPSAPPNFDPSPQITPQDYFLAQQIFGPGLPAARNMVSTSVGVTSKPLLCLRNGGHRPDIPATVFLPPAIVEGPVLTSHRFHEGVIVPNPAKQERDIGLDEVAPDEQGIETIEDLRVAVWEIREKQKKERERKKSLGIVDGVRDWLARNL